MTKSRSCVRRPRGSSAKSCSRPRFGTAAAERGALDALFDGTPIQPEPAPGLDVARVSLVNQGRVAVEQRFGVELTAQQRAIQISRARAALRRTVAFAQEHVAHALLELAHVAGPTVVRPQVALHELGHFLGQGWAV